MTSILRTPVGLLAAILIAPAAGAPQKYAEPSAAQYEVQEVDEIRIPMKDGVHLSASIFMPKATQPGERFPVLLHTTPYRESMSDLRTRGETPPYFSHYFAQRGYVKVYLQTRGTGGSEGVVTDREYSDVESSDAAEAIDWLSRQPWSSGKVGMYGQSWSGFIAARVAMRKPPALKAIMMASATEDVYSESDWYWNGILQINAYLNWIDLSIARSPEPDHPLTEKFFRERFDHEPWNIVSLRHQQYGPYWWPQQRVDANPSSIAVPTLMIGGFRDAYRDSIPRMLEHMKAPTQAIVGYWEHNTTGPGPWVSYQEQMLRWWDYWLKGRDTGVLHDPRLTVYMARSHEPSPWFRAEDIEGEWRADAWPPQGLTPRTLFLQPDHGLRESTPTASAQHVLQYIASAGIEDGLGTDPAQHGYEDQRAIDAFSLTYDSEPLTKELAILGRPRALLNGSATAKLAHWFVRLADVAPDGKVVLVTEGALNGAYRNDPARPEYLEPGRTYQFPVDLHFTGWVFRPGHRIRVAVSNAMWPVNWPSPYPMTSTLQLGPAGAASTHSVQASHFVLPVVPAVSDAPLPAFAMANAPMKWRPYYGRDTTIEHDPVTRTTTVTAVHRPPKDSPFNDEETMIWTVSDLHPELASARSEHRFAHSLPGREVVYEQHAEVRSDAANFYYSARRWVTENGKVVRERSWNEKFPRNFR